MTIRSWVWKTRQIDYLGIFDELSSTLNINVARFARNFFCIFLKHQENNRCINPGKNEEITAFNRKLVEWQKFREIHQLFLMKVCILDAAALMRWWWEFLIWSILLEHFFQLDFGMRGFFFVSDHWRLLINKWWERKLKEVASLRLQPEKNSRCLIKCCQFYYLKLQCNALFNIRKRD